MPNLHSAHSWGAHTLCAWPSAVHNATSPGSVPSGGAQRAAQAAGSFQSCHVARRLQAGGAHASRNTSHSSPWQSLEALGDLEKQLRGGAGAARRGGSGACEGASQRRAVPRLTRQGGAAPACSHRVEAGGPCVLSCRAVGEGNRVRHGRCVRPLRKGDGCGEAPVSRSRRRAACSHSSAVQLSCTHNKCWPSPHRGGRVLSVVQQLHEPGGSARQENGRSDISRQFEVASAAHGPPAGWQPPKQPAAASPA